MDVPFYDLQVPYTESIKDILATIKNVLSKAHFINGENVTLFESNFADYLEVNACVGVSNGLDGLELALRALDIGPGSIVAVPAHTFIASWTAILNVGATPIGVDVEKNGLINIEALININSHIDAIIPVHMHGSMVDMKFLSAFAQSKGIAVIEDASQAHGASIDGKKAGTFGDVGVFSLYPTKNLGGIGDGGIVATNSADLAHKIRTLANYGADNSDKYDHKILGYNCRLDEIQAAILNFNLSKLDNWNRRRIEIARIYFDNLNWSKLHYLQNFNNGNVFHHFCVLLNDRDLIRKKLLHKGIKTEIHYPRVAANEVQKFTRGIEIQYEQATFLSNHLLSLPMSPWHTYEQIKYVTDSLNEILNEN